VSRVVRASSPAASWRLGRLRAIAAVSVCPAISPIRAAGSWTARYLRLWHASNARREERIAALTPLWCLFAASRRPSPSRSSKPASSSATPTTKCSRMVSPVGAHWHYCGQLRFELAREGQCVLKCFLLRKATRLDARRARPGLQRAKPRRRSRRCPAIKNKRSPQAQRGPGHYRTSGSAPQLNR
jgi:hypothetical protein